VTSPWSEIREWVEGALGAPLIQERRLSAGNSRSSWLVTVASGGGDRSERRYVVRFEAGTGPMSGTALLEAVAKISGIRRPMIDGGIPVAPRAGGDVMGEIAVGLKELLPALEHDPDAARRAKFMQRLPAQLAQSWDLEVTPAAPPGDGANFEQQFEYSQTVAAAELARFPQAMAMARTPVQTLAVDDLEADDAAEDGDQ